MPVAPNNYILLYLCLYENPPAALLKIGQMRRGNIKSGLSATARFTQQRKTYLDARYEFILETIASTSVP